MKKNKALRGLIAALIITTFISGSLAYAATQITPTTIVETPNDHTLTARWRAIEYRVTYSTALERETVLPTDDTVYIWDDEATVKEAGTSIGYVFKEWNTDPAGNGTSYAPDSKITVNGDIALYAMFELGTYSASFKYKDNSEQLVTTTGHSLINPPADDSMIGYDFAGWHCVEKDMLWNFDSNTIVEDLTFTPVFVAKEFTVYFDSNGGSAPEPASKTVTYDEAYGELPTVTKPGYIFEGWYIDEDNN